MFLKIVLFYGEELLATRPTPKLEDHPLSAVRDCLFNIFTATLHIGGCSSIRNLRTCHAVVTGTHLSHGTWLQMEYSDTLESELNPFQNPVRVPRQFFPFKIIETGLIRSWVQRTRIFKIQWNLDLSFPQRSFSRMYFSPFLVPN